MGGMDKIYALEGINQSHRICDKIRLLTYLIIGHLIANLSCFIFMHASHAYIWKSPAPTQTAQERCLNKTFRKQNAFTDAIANLYHLHKYLTSWRLFRRCSASDGRRMKETFICRFVNMTSNRVKLLRRDFRNVSNDVRGLRAETETVGLFFYTVYLQPGEGLYYFFLEVYKIRQGL